MITPIGEALIIKSSYLVFFYRKIVKPLNTIGSGMELLREQDFSSRLSAGKAKQANSQNQQQDDEYVKEAFDSHGQIVLSYNGIKVT